MKVEFIKRAAPIGLAYGVGQTAEFEEAYSKELIERGYCKPLEAESEYKEEVKKAVVKTTTKKAVK